MASRCVRSMRSRCPDDCSKSCTGYVEEVRGGYLVAPRFGLEIFFIHR